MGTTAIFEREGPEPSSPLSPVIRASSTSRTVVGARRRARSAATAERSVSGPSRVPTSGTTSGRPEPGPSINRAARSRGQAGAQTCASRSTDRAHAAELQVLPAGFEEGIQQFGEYPVGGGILAKRETARESTVLPRAFLRLHTDARKFAHGPLLAEWSPPAASGAPGAPAGRRRCPPICLDQLVADREAGLAGTDDEGVDGGASSRQDPSHLRPVGMGKR